MKKIIFFLFIVVTSAFHLPTKAVYAETYARSYIVMEQNSGKILEGKDIHLRRSVASISKIMTAIIALESANLFECVVIGDEINNAVGSSLYLEKGTKITVIDLVYGLLLRSGNDAACAIAKHVGKTEKLFVEKMNKKACELHMKDSLFLNPHGLDIDDGGNVSSAYDMGLLMRYCLDNQLFRKIASSKSYLNKQKGLWVNKHKLIQKYEYATGGKTGYTAKARRTLVTSAKKDDLEIIVVTLDCGSDFAFHHQIFDKYFSIYQGIVFLQEGKNFIHDYVVVTKKKVVLMIEKKFVKGGVMIYQINVDSNDLTMIFMRSDKENIFVERIALVSFCKS